ncbi:MAG: hypothetical protein MHMPM18_000341 [Marteilia pararefringens]
MWDLLNHICSQFVEETVLLSSRFASHRSSTTLEARDVLYFLNMCYNFDNFNIFNDVDSNFTKTKDRQKNSSGNLSLLKKMYGQD